MPFMDGLETAAKIRENFNFSPDELPVILLSSSSDDERVIRACEGLGIQHKLIKPVKTQEIFNLLSRIHQKQAPEPVPENHPASPQVTDQQVTILVAEDNPVNMLLARTILKRAAANAIILEATNGIQVTEFCRKSMPDLIFMDVQMPEMNGYEATEAIRAMADGHLVPIVALTAGNVKDERDRCLNAGMNDFVVKPVVEQTIVAVLMKWLPALSGSDPVVENSPETLHFNLQKVKEHIGDDPQIIAELLKLTKSELLNSYLDLQEALANQDLPLLQQIGHKLYGTSVSSGLTGLAVLAGELEQLTSLEMPAADQLKENIKREMDIVFVLLNLQHKAKSAKQTAYIK